MRHVEFENAAARVTKRGLAAGESTGHHRHAVDYVIVPLTNGSLSSTRGETTTRQSIVLGVPYFREAGTEHDIANVGKEPVVFIEIELL